MDKEAQLFMQFTYATRRTRGTRWVTYLLNKHIVRAVFYRAERFLLQEEAGVAEWTWQLYRTNYCVVILFPGHLSLSENEAFSDFHFCTPTLIFYFCFCTLIFVILLCMCCSVVEADLHVDQLVTVN